MLFVLMYKFCKTLFSSFIIQTGEEKKNKNRTKDKSSNLTFLFSVLENKDDYRNYTPLVVHKSSSI